LYKSFKVYAAIKCIDLLKNVENLKERSHSVMGG